MTADATLLSQITMGRYSVGDASTDAITAATFTVFLGWAEADATADGIASALYDRAVVYLIADRIYQGQPNADKSTERIGNVSYTKFDEQSQWLKEYNKIKEQSATVSGVVPSQAVKRQDVDMFALDANSAKTFYDTSNGNIIV